MNQHRLITQYYLSRLTQKESKQTIVVLDVFYDIGTKSFYNKTKKTLRLFKELP